MPANAAPSSDSIKVTLVSTPWSLFNRPSIQLGVLQAYLKEKSDFPVRSLYFYLDVANLLGPETYHKLALSGWAGEALFAALLFPEMQNSARQVFKDNFTQSGFSRTAFPELSGSLYDLCHSWVAAQNFTSREIVGFTVCFNQLFASLYLARLVKAIVPEITVVFGGSTCSGEVGQSLLAAFPEIDYLIEGEGEEQLLGLCRYLSQNNCEKSDRYSNTATLTDTPIMPARQILNNLPPPDYGDYFQQASDVFGQNHFIPTIPVEFSRGCLWNKCTFCNLNLQWQDYRYKSAEHMFHEVQHLAASHETLNFTFTDNALPPAEADKFFALCASSTIAFDFFGEIRLPASPGRLATLRSGGLKTVQIGIESLSSSLLRKMNKGTTVMDNIAALKNCLANDIRMEGNLILEFPSAAESEVEETLRNLDFVLPFYPLQPATFFLGYGSPIFLHAREYGIRSISAHRYYKKLLPQPYPSELQLMVCDYRGDRSKQRQLWKPVRAKLKKWQEFQSLRPSGRPCALTCRDGETFLIIEQELPDTPALRHRLRGTSRDIYLFCDTPRSIREILLQFPKVSEATLRQFTGMMMAKKLMFTEDDKVLSLALRDS